MRFRVEPRCVPPRAAARRLGLTLAEFLKDLSALHSAGFPRPDAVTGHYDLQAIDLYIDRRNPELFAPTVPGDEAVTDHTVIRARLETLRDTPGRWAKSRPGSK